MAECRLHGQGPSLSVFTAGVFYQKRKLASASNERCSLTNRKFPRNSPIIGNIYNLPFIISD